MGNPQKKIEPGEVVIRRLKKEDVPLIIEIENLSFTSPWSGRLFLNELEHDFSCFLVLEYLGRLIGYAGFWLIAEEAHLTSIAIHPSFKRRGGGYLLIKSLLKLAYDAGARSATLEVRESNQPAIELYTKLNFQRVAIRKQYYADTQEDAIIMWLNPLEHLPIAT